MQLTVGNWIDIAFAVCLLVAIIKGWHRGLVMKLAHLAAMLIAYALAYGIATSLKSQMGSKVILPMIEKKAGKEVLSIPYAKESITMAADNLAYYLIMAVSFFVILIILYQLIKVLHIVDYIPVIGKVNKLGGAVAGFLLEFLFLFMICAILSGVVPQTVLDQWGLTKDVISHTYLLQAFMS